MAIEKEGNLGKLAVYMAEVYAAGGAAVMALTSRENNPLINEFLRITSEIGVPPTVALAYLVIVSSAAVIHGYENYERELELFSEQFEAVDFFNS